jgi:HTH-type transcriptional regulator, glycine betaine synthesis regulator
MTNDDALPPASSDDAPPGAPGASLWPSEALVSDVVGRLIEFWGFKRNLGRVWAILYLSPKALTAQDLRDKLTLSSGAVSMTLTELARWGVVRKVWVQGDRRDHFTAEVHLWRMISRVLAEREQAEIAAAIESFEEALRTLDARLEASPGDEDRAKALLQRDRIRSLLEFAKLGRRVLESLLSSARLDVEPLRRFVLASVAGRLSLP